MDGSSAETHLRRRAESVLTGLPASAAGPGGRPRVWELLRPVQDAATALVAVGSLDPSAAQRIEDELHHALISRGIGDQKSLDAGKRWEAFDPGPPGEPVRLAPRRGYACPADLLLAFGRVRLHYVVVTDDDDDPEGSMRLVGDLELPGPLPPPSYPARPAQRRESVLDHLADLEIADETGLRYRQVSRGGGGNERRARFQATIRPAPPPGTVRLLFGPTPDGRPVPVRLGPPAHAEVGPVEPRPAGPLVEEWLRARAEDALFDHLRGHMGPPDLDLDICADALIEVGVISADNGTITDVRQVMAVVGGTGLPDRLPARWRELMMSRGHDEDWEEVAVLTDILPPLGDVTVAIEAFRVGRGHAGFRAEMTPYDLRDRRLVTAHNITVRAVDDLGGRYLARPFSIGASRSRAEADYTLLPPLDPAARRLRLEISSTTHSCTLALELSGPSAT